MRPALPSAEQLLPYLKRIDTSRVYSNFGPLSVELQDRIAAMISRSSCSVICTSSGTSALIAGILATAGPATDRRRYAIVPALTFPATAIAAERCGYLPYLVDVDPTTWHLDPQKLMRHPLLQDIGLVLPVATFGKPVPIAPWLRFKKETRIPVVIDGAASFAAAATTPRSYLGKIPTAISFHATKSFGVGEGGCIAWSDADADRRVCEALNFGFYDMRYCVSSSSNGKMSEYHAAVGLAELSNWTDKVNLYHGAIRTYRQTARKFGFADRLVTYPRTDLIYPLLMCENERESLRVRSSLTDHLIGYQLWYGEGMQVHPYFRDRLSDDLDVTSSLTRRLIGLPMAPDLTNEDIRRVCAAIASSLQKSEVRLVFHNPKKPRAKAVKAREERGTGDTS